MNTTYPQHPRLTFTLDGKKMDMAVTPENLSRHVDLAVRRGATGIAVDGVLVGTDQSAVKS